MIESQIDLSAYRPTFSNRADLAFAAAGPGLAVPPEYPGTDGDFLAQSHVVAQACRCAACCGVARVDGPNAENTTFVSDFTALISGSSMSSAPGTGAFFTFSFPDQPPAYLSDFYTDEQLATFEQFSESYQQVARAAVEAFTAISGLTGFEVSPGQGDVQFMIYDLAAFPGFEDSAGFAYYPSRSPLGSDIFIDIGATSNSTNLYILLHELGHTFGLKHPFEGDIQLSDEFDNQSFTVMSYAFGQFDNSLGQLDRDAIINLYGDENADGNQISSWSWDQASETLTQTGDDSDETIYGLGANDIINGGGGNDTLWGLLGDDDLRGGEGDDRLVGGAGDNRLDGGSGNDTLEVSAGNNVLIGGAGNDLARVRIEDADTAFSYDGGAGNDDLVIVYLRDEGQRIATSALALTSVESISIYGTDAADEFTRDTDFSYYFVSAGDGDDILRAGNATGTTDMRGGAGDDILIAGNDFGFMFGNGGADRFVFTGAAVSNASARDQIEDFESGVDTVELSGFPVDDIEINGSFVTVRSSAGDVHFFVRTSITLADFGLGITGTAQRDELVGGEGSDRLFGGDGGDVLTGALGNDILDGGSNVDTAMVRGVRADYTVTQTATGVFEIVGPDGTDTLTNIEFLQFDDEVLRLLPGEGLSVTFETADPSVYSTAMQGIRDFDGNALGGDGNWLRIGSADVNGDGDIDQILVNDAIGRFATVGTAADGLVYFDDYGWAGETRVAGIYIDPLVQSGDVVAGGDNDSQRRFQNDLQIENINRVLGADDYDGDGIHEVYFALTDGTAYLRALMHDDGNIRYANYQSEQEVIDYLTANGFGEETYGDWFLPAPQAAASASAYSPTPEAMTALGDMPSVMISQPEPVEHQFYG